MDWYVEVNVTTDQCNAAYLSLPEDGPNKERNNRKFSANIHYVSGILLMHFIKILSFLQLHHCTDFHCLISCVIKSLIQFLSASTRNVQAKQNTVHKMSELNTVF